MRIGIPRESRPGETLVAATPKTASQLAALGYDVVVEAGAGQAADQPDTSFATAGITVGSGADVWGSDIVVKVNAPTADEIGRLAPGATVIMALLATLLLAAQKAEINDERNFATTLLLMLLMMAAGGAIGAWRARTVEMTGMPELVAMRHSFVGLAAVLVGINSYLEFGGNADAVHDVEVFVGVFIGAVTLTGSIVAWAKLSGKMSSSPMTLPGRHWLNLGVIVVSVLLMFWFVALDLPHQKGSSVAG